MQLNPATACTFLPPNNINYARIKGLHRHLKKSAPRQYKGLKGRTFYFEFPSTIERDDFLNELQTMLAAHGNESQRIN